MRILNCRLAISFHSIVAVLCIPVMAQLALNPNGEFEGKKATTEVLPADYDSLANTKRDYTNFNPEVKRGFDWDKEGNLWAINSYQSTLVLFTSQGNEKLRVRTLNQPVCVSVSLDHVFVLGYANHALAKHDLRTGEIVDVIMLRSEPGDLVIDEENQMAFVTCMADDSLLEIDLSGTAMTINRVWNNDDDGFRMKRPGFLFLDDGGNDFPGDNVIFVAPMTSGNNTLTNQVIQPIILDGNWNMAISPFPAPFPAIGGGLPDEDIFRIAPYHQSGGTTGICEPVIREAGSLIQAHGRHPNGNYYVLNVDHFNTARFPNFEPLPFGVRTDQPSEPILRGNFAANVLTIFDQAMPAVGSAPAIPPEPGIHVDLDNTSTMVVDTYDTALPAVYDTTGNRSAPFPWSLDFDQATGNIAVGSSMNSLVLLLDSTGKRLEFGGSQVSDIFFPNQGEVIRTVRFRTIDSQLFLFVYCQQTNVVLQWEIDPSSYPYSLARKFDLGHDPTPTPVKAGRGIFYDASNSTNGRFSCNTCHPGGGADGITWLIADRPVDEKGPQVTQSLKGIEDTFPYHWRGERDLADFNVAFRGLLGGEELEGRPLKQFMEFVFSLRPEANARQTGPPTIDLANNRLNQYYGRKLHPSLTPHDVTHGVEPNPPPANPINGQEIFLGNVILPNGNVAGNLTIGANNNVSCEGCHQNPTGTNGDLTAEVATPVASLVNLNVTHLDNQLVQKTQPLVDLVISSDPLWAGLNNQNTTLLGTGYTHNGGISTVFEFISLSAFEYDPNPTTSLQQRVDLTSFLEIFDTGTPPAVHYAGYMDSTNHNLVASRVQANLLDQSAHIGVVLTGSFKVGAGKRLINWYYDPVADVFIPEDNNLMANQSLAQLEALAQVGDATMCFMGVPCSNQFWLGSDFDLDGYDTAAEHLISNGKGKWVPDTPGPWTGPPQLVGMPVVEFTSTNMVKFHFETTRPANWRATLVDFNSTGVVPTVVDSRLTKERFHTAVVHHLKPSTVASTLGSGETVDYRLDLKLTGDNGSTTTIIGINAFATTADLVENATVNGNADFQNIIEELTFLSQSWNTSTRTYDAQVKVKVVHQENVDGGAADPAVGVYVIAQLLDAPVNPGTEGDFDQVPGSKISFDVNDEPLGTEFKFTQNIQMIPTPITYDENYTIGLEWAIEGPFIVMKPTDSNGETTVTYEVAYPSSDPAGKQVMFNIIAIVVNDPASSTGVPPNQVPTWDQIGTGNYQLPATHKTKRNILGNVEP